MVKRFFVFITMFAFIINAIVSICSASSVIYTFISISAQVSAPLATNLIWSTDTPGQFSFDVRATIPELAAAEGMGDSEYFAVSLYKDGVFVNSIMGEHTTDVVQTQTWHISDFYRNSEPESGDYVFSVGAGDENDIKSPSYTYVNSNGTAVTLTVDITLIIGSVAYNKNGQDQISDVAPYISSDGRTMVPIRFISEALGATVNWDDTTQTDTIVKGGVTLQIVVGQSLPNNLGTAVLKDNRLFVPVRYVSEQLGANISWNADTQTVRITQ